MSAEIHIELWQLITALIAWTGSWTAVVFRLTKYLTIEDYKEQHRELEKRVAQIYAGLENRIRDIEIRNARRNGLGHSEGG